MLVYLCCSVGDDGVAEPENMGIVDRSQVRDDDIMQGVMIQK